MQELSIPAIDNIEYQLPVINIKNYDEIKANLTEYLSKYQGYVVTKDSYASDKKLRASLNKEANKLDGFRKDIKRELTKPILEANNDIKSLVDMINEVTDNISSGVKTFDDEAKATKHAENLKVIEQLAAEYGVDPVQVEYNSSWDNKSSDFKKFDENVKFQLERLKFAQQKYDEDVKVIENFADTLKMPAQQWIDSLKYKQLDEILNDMRKAKRQSVEYEEHLKQKREAEKAADQATQVVKDDKVINKNTGEIVDEILTYNLKIKGTSSQLFKLKAFMNDNGITYEKA